MFHRASSMRAAAALAGAAIWAAVAQAGAGGAADEGPARPDEPPAGTEIVHPADGSIMVWVPSGWFIMGMDAPEAQQIAARLGYAHYHDIAAEEWFPRRREHLTGYFIDKYEVTHGQWARFAAATGYKAARSGEWSPASEQQRTHPLYPVVSVLWAEAQAFANWCGRRLPTEAQWEKAARGTDGRIYPWGNEPPTTNRGVFVDLASNTPTACAMVGSRPAGASPYGCMDMAGNVYEWTSEWFEPYPNNPEAGRLLPYTGHVNGCLRGGSFYHATHAYIAAKRFGFKPDETYFHVGFRTAWTPPEGYFSGEAFARARAAVAGRQAEIESLRTESAAP